MSNEQKPLACGGEYGSRTTLVGESFSDCFIPRHRHYAIFHERSAAGDVYTLPVRIMPDSGKTTKVIESIVRKRS